jgi:rare lipoprotein A
MRSGAARALVLCAAIGLAGCGVSVPRFTSEPGTAAPVRDAATHQLSGIASYYADEFNGRPTANGEQFDMYALTAAHRTLPFNTIVRVTNTENGLSVEVRINDRGPFKDDRVIDLSLAAAQRIGLISKGTGPVILSIIEAPASPAGEQ